MSKGYIYIIDPHLKVQGRSVVKIGLTTRSPNKRLKEIQTSLPHRASMINVTTFPDVKWAEKRLHQALSSRNVRAKGGTEFFFLSQQEAIEIVNALAYQVSVDEAKRALDRELERFSDKVSNGLQSKIAKFFAVAVYVGTIALLVRDNSLSMLFIFALVAVAPALFGGAIGMGVGEVVVKILWKEEIALEREKLLEKYPAARQVDKR